MSKEDNIEVTGVVLEKFPSGLFRVKLEHGWVMHYFTRANHIDFLDREDFVDDVRHELNRRRNGVTTVDRRIDFCSPAATMRSRSICVSVFSGRPLRTDTSECSNQE